MKLTTRNVLLAGLAGVSILSAAAVIASGPGCAGEAGNGPSMMGHGPGWGGQRHAAYSLEDRAGWRLKILKSELDLLPTQVTAWNAFSTAAQAQARQMEQLREAMRAKAGTLPERMELAKKSSMEREQGMVKVMQAMKSLYETLTPEQRKVLDAQGPMTHG